MRILLVSQYYYPERNSNKDIAEGLVKLGHRVSVITGKPNYGFQRILPEYKKVKYEVLNGVEIYRINLFPRQYSKSSIYFNYLSFYFNAKRFTRHLKQEFDVVLSISLSPVISIAPAIVYSKKHRVPHILICEDLWPESTVVTKAVKYNSLIYKFLYSWSRNLYKKCDEIIISSPSFKEYFHDVLKLQDKEYVYINQPIIQSESNEKEAVKYNHKYNLVYAGNIGTLQLTENLVRAFSLISNRDAALHLMGMGNELIYILELINDLKMNDRIFYHGALPIEEAERYYKNADALIVSLKDEGYVGKTIPNKAIQYMKYQKPLIGVIKGDGKELLEKAKGTLFANENPIDIAKCIENFFSLSSKDKEMMGTNNFAYFNENLSSEKLVKKIEKELLKHYKK